MYLSNYFFYFFFYTIFVREYFLFVDGHVVAIKLLYIDAGSFYPLFAFWFSIYMYLSDKFFFCSSTIFVRNHFLFVDGLGQTGHHYHHYQDDDSKDDKDEMVVERKAETISE